MTKPLLAILVGLCTIALAGSLTGQDGDYIISDSFGAVYRGSTFGSTPFAAP